MIKTNTTNIDNLPLSENEKRQIKTSISSYLKVGIDIQVLNNNTVIIKQTNLINGYILNNKQLHERAREIFKDKKIKIVPAVYSVDLSIVDFKWINDKMKEFDITRNDLIKQLGIDKSTISEYFSESRGMPKGVRALFYYYFLTYEINRNLREYING